MINNNKLFLYLTIVWIGLFLLFPAFHILPHPDLPAPFSLHWNPEIKQEKRPLYFVVYRSHLSEGQNGLSDWRVYFWLRSRFILGLFMKFYLVVLSYKNLKKAVFCYFIHERQINIKDIKVVKTCSDVISFILPLHPHLRDYRCLVLTPYNAKTMVPTL